MIAVGTGNARYRDDEDDVPEPALGIFLDRLKSARRHLNADLPHTTSDLA
jgi:hypothetical protein